jgi:lipopolysaccharide biosynthesis glycosyltransferase
MSVSHIACAADGGYIPHSAAMLHSVLSHRGGLNVQIHYLHAADLPSRTAGLLTEMVESQGARISFLEVAPERVADLPEWEYVSSSAWFRIYLPELLPEVERILYLDVDTIVVDSLEVLLATDLDDHYVGAVTNVPELDQIHQPSALGLGDWGAYFNSGVLLMNLSLMREDDCSTAMREYTLEHASDVRGDQDPLNAVLGNKRVNLHPRWNCMNSVLYFPWAREVFGVEELEEARRRPAIRHFEGPSDNKPWHYLCRWSMRELYFFHRQQTPWPTLELEGVTPRNRLKRLLRPWRHREGRTVRVGAPPPR